MAGNSYVYGIFFGDDYLIFVFVLIGILSVIWFCSSGSTTRFPPGPRGLPVVGSIPFLEPELHKYFQGLSRKYGPILKLKLGSKIVVVVTSPDLAKEIFKNQDINFSNHDVPLTAITLTYGGKDIVWPPYGPEWRMARKVCVVGLLNRQTLDSLYQLRRQEVRQRVKYLYEQGEEGKAVDLGDQMFATLMNLMENMLWGGTLKGEKKASMGTEFKHAIEEATRLMGEPNVSDFFPWLARFDLQGHVKGMKRWAGELDEMLNRAIEEWGRIANDGTGKSKDFLQQLLKLKDEGGTEVPMTLDHIKAILLDLVFGGTETSASTLEFAMAELIKRPEMMKRAQQEVDEIVGKDNIVEESHIGKLPYILAIMKETLRLYPTVPLLVPRTPTETTVVGGYVIPQNCKVFVNAWAIMRDPDLWENPLDFHPERFLEKSCDFSGNDLSFIPFGSGRRKCAGVALAERIVLYILATLLHSFDWKIPEGKRCEVEEKFGLVFKLKNPLIVMAVPRLSDPNLYL